MLLIGYLNKRLINFEKTRFGVEVSRDDARPRFLWIFLIFFRVLNFEDKLTIDKLNRWSYYECSLSTPTFVGFPYLDHIRGATLSHRSLSFFPNVIFPTFFFYGVLFPQHLQTRSVAVSHRSLKNFGMYNFLNIIFPKLHFHIPPIFTNLFSCKLK